MEADEINTFAHASAYDRLKIIVCGKPGGANGC